MFTCGRDLFRIGMTIDLHVWSSIAGYGSSKRCWLGDQKCGQFRLVVCAHFELLSSIFSFSVTRHSAMHGSSCSFHLFTTIWPVALDVGYIGIKKSELFPRWAIVKALTFKRYRALWMCKYLREGKGYLIAGKQISSVVYE